MYRQPGFPQCYLVTGFTDFRCGINSLCRKLTDLGVDNLTGNVAYIFMNKKKKCLKILYRGGDGFWLLVHSLCESKYRRINDPNNIKSITRQQVERLLDGLELEPKNYHREVQNQQIY